MIEEQPWKDQIDFRIYHLDEDPKPARKYDFFITWSTVVVNERLKVVDMTRDKVLQAIQLEVLRAKHPKGRRPPGLWRPGTP